MKKCFWAPGRVIFLCNESGFCQRKEPARSAERSAGCAGQREPASPPTADGLWLTSGELRSPSAPPARPRGAARPRARPRRRPGPQVGPPPRVPAPRQAGTGAALRRARWGGSAPAPRQAGTGGTSGGGGAGLRIPRHLPQAAERARRPGRGAGAGRPGSHRCAELPGPDPPPRPAAPARPRRSRAKRNQVKQ